MTRRVRQPGNDIPKTLWSRPVPSRRSRPMVRRGITLTDRPAPRRGAYRRAIVSGCQRGLSFYRDLQANASVGSGR